MSGPAQPTKTAKPPLQNRVRIIGGNWRSRLIEFPVLRGLRPTPDRVRETLFNWLGQTMAETRCLDLFAGSGALGFEAASRGAVSVTMVESARAAVDALHRNRERLAAMQCHIIFQDAIKVLETLKESFDVIFLDPPFSSELLPVLLPKLVACLKPNGVVYAEWREPLLRVIARLPADGWNVVRAGQAGAAHFALLSHEKSSRHSNEVAQ